MNGKNVLPDDPFRPGEKITAGSPRYRTRRFARMLFAPFVLFVANFRFSFFKLRLIPGRSIYVNAVALGHEPDGIQHEPQRDRKYVSDKEPDKKRT